MGCMSSRTSPPAALESTGAKANHEEQIDQNEITGKFGIGKQIVSEEIIIQLDESKANCKRYINAIFDLGLNKDTQSFQKAFLRQTFIPAVKDFGFLKIMKANNRDQELISLMSELITFLQTQPAMSCLFKGDYIVEIIEIFDKRFVNKQITGDIFELILAIVQDSIKFVNDGRMAKSQYIAGETIGFNRYIPKIAAKIQKIQQETFFTNKDTLKMLDYAYEDDKNKNSKNCYQHLLFDFSDDEVKKVALEIKKICKYDLSAFAYLSNYLLQCCYNMEKKDKSTPHKINEKISKTIEMLRIAYPPADGVKFNEKLLNIHQKMNNQACCSKIQIDLKKIQSEKRVESLEKFIEERVKQSQKNYPLFLEIVKDVCIQEKGYHFKTGLKLSNMKNKKAVDRIKEKMLSAEFNKYILKQNFNKNLNDLFTEEYHHYEKEMKQMYDRTEKNILFEVSDMVRGKCMFPTVENINNCATSIMQKILKKNQEGLNCHIAQVDNRLGKNTCDLVLKIQINETICEFQLTSDKVNTVDNQFNHKLFEIARSKFFTPISMLYQFNQQISERFFGQILSIIETNVNSVNSQENRKYQQKVTFQIANIFMPNFIKLLPTKIIKQNLSIGTVLVSRFKEKLQKLKNIKIKTQNITDRMKDVLYRNGNLKYQLNQYKIAEQELLQYCQRLKQECPTLFSKIKEQTWSQITTQQKAVANKYYQINHTIGLINMEQCYYKKAISYFQFNSIILGENLLDQKRNYSINLNLLGQIYHKQGDQIKAIEFYEKCLKIQQILEKDTGKGCYGSAITLNNIGNIYYNRNNYDKAIQYYEFCLLIQEKEKNKACFESAATLNNIASVYNSQQNYEKAIEYFQRCLEIKEKAKGKDSIDSTSTLNNLASVYNYQKKYDKAIEYYSRCVEIQQKVKGKGCIDNAITFNNIASVHKNKNDFNKAIEFYQYSLNIEEKVKGKECLDSASTLNNIAFALQSKGEFDKAIQTYQRAIKIEERYKNCNQSLNYALQNWNLGLCFINKKKDYASAIPCFLKIEPIYQKVTNIKLKYKECLNTLQVCYKQTNNISKANQYRQKMLKVT